MRIHLIIIMHQIIKHLTIVLLLYSSFAFASEIFTRDETANAGGTYLVEQADLIPRFLVSRFGQPSEGDGIRVSGEYTFVSNSGDVFTVHDYKSTTLWATDEGLPTPEQFWASEAVEDFSIGGRGDSNAKEFVGWLLKEQETWKGRQQ